MKQKYGIYDAYKNKQKSGTISFVLTQINAARCIGEQDQKNKLEINNSKKPTLLLLIQQHVASYEQNKVYNEIF